MKVHMTNIYGMTKNSVAQIAQNMTSQFGKQLGFNEIGIYNYPVSVDSPTELSKRFDGMVASVSNNDIVIYQAPSWNTIEFDHAFVDHLKRYSKLKLIIFIHDVPPLMFAKNRYLLPTFIDFYQKADLLIVPSEQMYHFLRENGLAEKKYVVQHMWDHPLDANMLYDTTEIKRLNFAGDPTKFTFVQDWQHDTPLHLFASKKPTATDLNLIYEGWLNDAELCIKLSKNGGFGLVWNDGGYTQEYTSKYISYKLGSYLAAGLPVIIPCGISNEELIIKNKLGFAVDSITEALEKLERLTQEEYLQYKNAVKEFAPLLQQGYFTKQALVQAVFEVLQA